MNILTQKFKELTYPLRVLLIKKELGKLGLKTQLAEILVDGTVNYNGDVNLHFKNLKKLPFKFGVVTGTFNCSDNHLITLKNAPHTVGGDFFCSRNKLTSLEFMPKSIGGTFFCRYNALTSLKYCPTIINGEFDCSENQLTTLEHCPTYVGGTFEVSDNNIETLKFFPKEITGNARLVNNVVQDILTLPRCTVGEEFLIGGLRHIHVDDDEHNTAVVAIEDSELEYKFKSDEVKVLKDSLTVDLNQSINNNKRKMKV